MRGTMVVVDTSVFVQHFRGKKDLVFRELLTHGQILLSPFVRLELLQGVRKNEFETLHRVLGGLTTVSITESVFGESERLLVAMKSSGLTLGVVDLLLAAHANMLKCPIYSLDKAFDGLAKRRLVAVL